jgi:hypothetical protein
MRRHPRPGASSLHQLECFFRPVAASQSLARGGGIQMAGGPRLPGSSWLYNSTGRNRVNLFGIYFANLDVALAFVFLFKPKTSEEP